MARANVSQRELARLIPMPQSALSRRVGRNADVDLTVDEVAQIAQALGVDAEGLLVAALCACRDSNPKPSDLESCPCCGDAWRPGTLCGGCGWPGQVARVPAPFELARCPICGAWTIDGLCRTGCHTTVDAEWILAA